LPRPRLVRSRRGEFSPDSEPEALDGIAPDDDGFLFEWGVYDDDRFYLGFLRQFSFYTADGEYDHMEQLRCTFHFEPTPDLRALGKGHDWWFRSEPRRTLGRLGSRTIP
jgi:hypothetical protein